VATDEAARAYLHSRGITALPVTIIDDTEVIIGYYPRKLIPALRLEVQVDLSGKTSWLSAKYNAMLGATLRAVQQLSDAQLQQRLPWRERWMLRDLLMHVLSFPELAWLSHEHGSMSTDDMRAANVRLQNVQTSEEIAAYGTGVRQHILAFLQSNDAAAFDRVVPAHYGGEVTVLELLTIILSHSTHHLKQAYWFMTHELGVAVSNPMTDDELEGIVTPAALF
jgi:uncharacterized damage-inducible protein DinB